MPRTLPLLVTTALLVPSTVPAQDSAASAQVKRGEPITPAIIISTCRFATSQMPAPAA